MTSDSLLARIIRNNIAQAIWRRTEARKARQALREHQRAETVDEMPAVSTPSSQPPELPKS